MATFYVWPGATFNGDGTLPTQASSAGGAGAYNTWSGITLSANNTYRQKRGTSYVGASVRPQSQTSAASTPLTIEAYYNADGSDNVNIAKPIIDHNNGTNGVGAVFVDTCSYVIVRNIDGRNSNGSLGGGVTVRRSQNVTITKCIGRDSEHGILIQQDQASGTSTCTDVTVSDCDTYNNVSGGITFRWGAVSTAVLKRIRILRNRVYSNGTGKGTGANAASVPCGGIMSYAAYKTDTDINYRNLDIIIDSNVVTWNNGYGINLEMADCDRLGSAITNNEVAFNGASLDVDAHSVWCGNSFNVLVGFNEIHHNYARANFTSGSGVGIFIDYNGTSAFGGSGNLVVGNRIRNQYRGITQVTNGSAGIHVLLNTNTLVQGNVIENCRNGIIVQQSSTDVVKIYRNTIRTVDEFGICVQPSVTNVTVTDNIVEAATVGIFCATVGTTNFSETYNNVYNCTTARANGTAASPSSVSLDATDKTVNPGIGSGYFPTNSAVKDAGSTVPGVDFYGKEATGSINMGAVENWPTRSTVSRSVSTRSMTTKYVATRRATAGA